MKPRSWLVLLVVVAGASVCVRLGFWQLSRLHEKQALNATLHAALTSPPLVVSGALPPADSGLGRVLEVRGVFDETRQVLLSGRAHDGSPGVDVVTPLRLPGVEAAVLVNRGWLYANDAATARPQDFAEPGERTVRGVAEPLPRGVQRMPTRLIESDSLLLLGTARLDADSLERHFPYALAAFVLHELPGPGVPERPGRTAPRPFDEMMHLSYAVQWFLFATILVVGSAALAWSRRRATPAGDAAPRG